MYRSIPLLLIIATVYAQNGGGNNGDLESVLQEIFGKPPGSGGVQPSDPPGPTPTQIPVTTPLTVNRGEASTLVPGIAPGNDDTTCTTDKGEPGECVRYYLCNVQNNSVITDGVGIIDIRLNGPCPSYMDTCCLVPDKRPTTDPITPPPPTKEEIREGCGWRNPNGVAFRITGDTQNEYARFAEFPWMVAVLKIEPVNDAQPDGQKLNVYVGGGSLIHTRVVLTAAHYVAEPKSLKVRAGEWDTQTTKEIYPYQDRDVDHVEIHKDFNKGNLFYDIALLFMTKPMDLAPNVGLACLPPPRERVEAGTRCFATGWGKDKYGKDGEYQVILKKVEVPVVDRQTCQNELRKTRLGRFFELHTSFMCAGGEVGKDTCKGDGGSPLVCPIQYENDRYVQNGIVAWGIGCGENKVPAVYVDVGNLRNWIDDKVAGRGFEPRTYSY